MPCPVASIRPGSGLIRSALTTVNARSFAARTTPSCRSLSMWSARRISTAGFSRPKPNLPPPARRPASRRIARRKEDAMAGAHDHAVHAHADDHQPHGWRRFVYSTNHKDIGTMYLVFAIMAGLLSGVMSIMIRAELMYPGL